MAQGSPDPGAGAGRKAGSRSPSRGDDPAEVTDDVTPDTAGTAEVADVVDIAADPAVTEAPEGAEEAAEPETSDDGDGDGHGDRQGEADLQAAADALEVDLEMLLAEREQYLDAYRRAQADFENYRKQAQKRQDDAVVRSLSRFVEGLLPVLDACDAALAHGASEVEPVLAALYGALSKEGLERIDPKGSPFDPAEAEAVLHEPGEGGEQVVADVLRTGYRWQGRVIRPAMVKVTD
jgi:molecular chaperone GrpE